MNSRPARLDEKRTRKVLPPYPPRVTVAAGWRDGAALAVGFLVMLVTAWLVWVAFAEAALALAEAGQSPQPVST
jgi:hypothetical protein